METDGKEIVDRMMKGMPRKLFVTGTDTDAGKSYATGWFARLINQSGGNAMTMKFVQTGNKDYSEDIAVHRRIMGIEMTEEDLNHLTAPEIYSYPCSPDLAAKIDSRPIDLAAITEASDRLAEKYDTVLIEGAGGIMVPLSGEYLTIDYIRDHRLPVVLVTNSRLGSINHTLLSLSAIERAGLELYAVIYNSYFDTDKIIAEDTRKYIKKHLENHFADTLFIEMNRII